jgi:hypothetical protein
MKFKLIAIICLTQLLTSCSKSGGSGSTPTPTLSATETSMLGKWYLKKERCIKGASGIINDTVITSFNNTPYIEFKSTQYSSAGVSGWDIKSKNYTDNAYLVDMGSSFRGSITTNEAWYVDANTGLLIARLIPFQFSVNSKDLTLSRSQNISGFITIDTLFFQK